jgi:selenocysteine-specific elongation factor
MNAFFIILKMEEKNEKSFTVGILGSNHNFTKIVGESLGSPGTRSDLQYYNRLDSSLNCVFTAVDPVGYPEKIKSLIQSCAETEIHILVIDAEIGITPEMGEIIVLIDIFAREFNTKYIAVITNISKSNDWMVSKITETLMNFTKSTSIHDIEILTLRNRTDFEDFKRKIYNIGLTINRPDPFISQTKVLIDHVFPVKGIGTVLLGLVTRGVLNAGEMYDLYPIQSKVILRSIQKFDRNFKTAIHGDRVGLAIKKIKTDRIDRNCVFVSMNSVEPISKKCKVSLEVSPYYSGKISHLNKKVFHISSDLATTPVKIIGGDEIGAGESGILELELGKTLAKPIDGYIKGIMADFEPFNKKLRIVGYYRQLI